MTPPEVLCLKRGRRFAFTGAIRRPAVPIQFSACWRALVTGSATAHLHPNHSRKFRGAHSQRSERPLRRRPRTRWPALRVFPKPIARPER